MLGHLGVDVADLTIASGYNGGLMSLLGYETFLASKDTVAFRPADGRRGASLFFYAAEQDGPYSRRRPGLQHLAFTAPTRGAVRAVHDHVVAAGSVVLHPPRAWSHD